MATFDRPLEDPIVEKLLVAAILRINADVKTEIQAKLGCSNDAPSQATPAHIHHGTANQVG